MVGRVLDAFLLVCPALPVLAGGVAQGLQALLQGLGVVAGAAAPGALVQDEQHGRANGSAVAVAGGGFGGVVANVDVEALLAAVLDGAVEVALVVVELAGDLAHVGHRAAVKLQEGDRDAELGQADDGVGDDVVLAGDGVGCLGGPGFDAARERAGGQGAAWGRLACVGAGWGVVGGGAGDGSDDQFVDEHGVRGAGGSGAAGVAAHVAVVAERLGGGGQAEEGEADDLLRAGPA
ncbi:hypothetical protein ACIRRH_43030 [Kitasatospora sp. NPDC101235]|uniref:hypothetical protein n=1 Tax=Kitasatospora sp. NPDC101235 TaxID=3364101 RepID=UPI003813B156